MELFTSLFGARGFLPHGYCFTWTPGLLWSMVGADSVIAASYLSIPLTLAVYMRRRKGPPSDRIVWLFCAFILACGMTHVMDIWVIWRPDYGVQALVKTITALISVCTAALLWPMLPRMLARPTNAQLQEAIDRLAAAQVATARERELMRTLISALPDVVYTMDRSGRFGLCNPAAAAFFGRDGVDGLVGACLDDVVPAERLQRMRDDAEAVLAGQPVIDREDRWDHDGRSQRWFLVTKLPLLDGDGNADAFLTVKREITSAKLAEVALNEQLRRVEQTAHRLQLSEQRYRSLFEQNPDVVYALDTEGRFESVNAAFQAVSGYAEAQAVGMHSTLLIAEESRADAEAGMARALRGQPARYEATAVERGGARVALDVTNLPIVIEGRVVGIFGIAKDITIRREAERIKREEQQRLSLIFAGAATGIAIAGVDGRFLEANPAYCDLLGYSLPQLRERTIQAVTHPEDRAYSQRLVDAMLSGQSGSYIVEKRYLSSSGGVVWVRGSVTLIPDEHGRPLHQVGIFEDITTQKLASIELARNRALIDIAGRMAQLGGWSIELPSMTLHLSDVAVAVHDEASGHAITLDRSFDYYLPEHRPVIREALQRCIEDGTPFDLELQMLTARGRRRWVRSTGDANRDAQGRIVGVHGALQDISERREAQQKSIELSERLRDTLESLTDGFIAYDEAWRVTYVNREAERLVGRPRASLLGQVFWVVFPDLAGGRLHAQCLRSRLEGAPLVGEVHLEGAGLWLDIRTYPSAQGLSVHLRDITESRRSNEQMRLLQACIAQLNDIVLITEATPHDEPGPRILFVNDAFERTSGYTREEVLGRTPRLLQGPLTDRTVLDRVHEALRLRSSVHVELVNYTKGGLPYWIEVDIVPVAADGEHITHFVAIERDITERKRHEEALRSINSELEARVLQRTQELRLARDDAQRASQAKSTFLAMMSHEIRTPMNGVIGMIDVLQQTRLPAPQIEMVGVIRDSAYSLLNIIDDILDLSKIEAGRLQVAEEALDFADVVEKSCTMLETSAIERNVDLEVFADPALPGVLLGDETRTRQVLVNLIGNAIKFSSRRDRAGRVSVRAVLLGRRQGRVTVGVTVADDGIGMDQQTLDRLFTPFTQADVSTTRRFGGTGLGLAITQMLVQLMGGAITVRSVPEQGSAFEVRLDLTEPALTARGDERMLPLAGLNCRVIGARQPLAADAAAYLAASGAEVESVPDLDTAGATGGRASDGVWLVLSDQNAPSAARLRKLALRSGAAGTRFVVFRPGRRRRPRIEAHDVVSVEAGLLLRRTLVGLVEMAAGREDGRLLVSDEPALAPAGPAATREEARHAGRLVLVAEDNETNRRVIQKQLDLIGVTAVIAESGREALAHWRSGEFALLMTDLHMPDMDGYALARAIRAEEDPGRRIPMIALTANALLDEERRCREAGMDLYLTKPVKLPRLRAAIEELLGGAPPERDPPTASAAAVAVAPAADLAVLESLVGNDRDVIAELVAGFCSSARLARDQLVAAARMQSWDRVSMLGHRMKSGARSVGADRLGNLCEALERCAERQDPEGVDAALLHFERELAAVLSLLGEPTGPQAAANPA